MLALTDLFWHFQISAATFEEAVSICASIDIIIVDEQVRLVCLQMDQLFLR